MPNEFDELMEHLRRNQVVLEERAARIEATYAAQERRLSAVETSAAQRIRGLEAQVADQTDTLRLAGETMGAVMDVCRRNGFDPASGLSAIEWLEYVLKMATTGWSSVN